MKLKLLFILIAAVIVTGCAKPAPPPAEPRPMIPIMLVNIEKNTIVAIPDKPSDQQLVHIRKNDPADEALADVLDYTKDLKIYATKVTEIATECKAELDDRDERLHKIKQYIILNQRPSVQPVY